MAGTISPPPRMVTAAPISLKRSAERPTVRYFRPLNAVALLDRLLEPAERLCRHRTGEEADEIEAEDLLYQFVVEFLAAAIFHPADHLVGAPSPGRRRSEQRIGLVLAVPIGTDAMTAVERSGDHRVLHFEGLGHRARRQKVELQPAAGHRVDAGDIVLREFVEDVLRRPGALELEDDRLLRLGDLRHGDRRRAGHRRGAGLQKFPPRRNFGFAAAGLSDFDIEVPPSNWFDFVVFWDSASGVEEGST